MKWKSASRILCDPRIPIKLKGKIYEIAIILAMLYGNKHGLLISNIFRK